MTARFDVTKVNVAVERLLERTENPRHHYLLSAYNRHRYLEIAGRYQEIFTPEMTVEHPVYRLALIGQPPVKLDGRDEVEALYRGWTETQQNVFYAEDEVVAVSDNMVVSRMVLYQQVLGGELVAGGLDADEDAMYLAKMDIAMLWPYDDQGRMIGEDVWEYDGTGKDYIKLEPGEVLTVEQAAEQLAPLIKPLPALQETKG
jgi:hypothetical protein